MGIKQTVLSFDKKFIRNILWATALLLVLSMATVLLHPQTTYAACPPGQTAGVPGTPQGDPTKCYAPGNPNPVSDNTDPNLDQSNDSAGAQSDAEDSDDELSCAISKMGWILCPLIETFASVGDQAFQFLATTFLETEPELVASVGNVEGKSGTYIAWELARNIANILFIIAFLVIILSQVTGRGIDNYGIKKTLPRLVIAAIAVNVSYYICQAMVDLSNILGYEIQNFLVEVSRRVSDQTAMPPNTGGTVNSVSGGTLGVIAAAVLGAAAIVWVLLPILMLGVGTVVITCIVIIIILLLRKAFIVLLVVASPIAFVAYLLPNTESYFRKWLSMFWKLLMVFPVVGLLFGGGQLASAIILVAGTSNTTDRSAYSIQTEENADKQCVRLPSSEESTGSDNPDNPVNQGTSGATIGACESRSVPLMLGLVAAGIAVAPLLAVWAVLKGALNGAGAIGGKITGAVDTYTNKGADWASKNTSIGRGMTARKAIKQNYKDQKFADKMGGNGRRGRLTRVSARGVTGNLGRLPVAPGSMKAQHGKLSANFASASAKIQDQEVNEKQALFNAMLQNTRGEKDSEGNIDEGDKLAYQLEQAIKNGDEAGAKAAVNILASMGEHGTGKLRKAIENTDTIDNKAMREMKAHIQVNQSGLKASDADIYSWAGSSPHGRLADPEHTEYYKKLTDAQLATQTYVSQTNAIKSGALNPTSAARIYGNTDIRGTIKGRQLERIESMLPRTTSSPPSP